MRGSLYKLLHLINLCEISILDFSLQRRNGGSESLHNKVTELINGRFKIHTRSAFSQNSCWGWGGGVRGHEAVCLLVREISALSLKCSQIIRKWEPTEWDVFRTIGE